MGEVDAKIDAVNSPDKMKESYVAKRPGIMSGIRVRLATASEPDWADTPDHLYIGVFGKGGGREVCLDVEQPYSYETGSRVEYHLGVVYDDATNWAIVREPWQSNLLTHPKGWNVPCPFLGDNMLEPAPQYPGWIALESIEYVYLRKAGSRLLGNDDAYVLESIDVWLFGGAVYGGREQRMFERKGFIRLSNETGQQVWLKENLSEHYPPL